MKINKTNEFIEVIGHYDNEVQCAKMTLLAYLYAIEHREGYAKFPLSVEDKLQLIDEKLEFIVNLHVYGLGVDEPIYAWYDFGSGSSEFGGEIGTVSTSQFVDFPSESAGARNIYLSSSNTSVVPITNYKIVDVDSTITWQSLPQWEITNDTTIHRLGYGSSGDEYVTITVAPPTPKVSIDLTTLSGWDGLADGAHSITVKAKATGYRDSEASQAVSVTKAPSGYTVTFSSVTVYGRQAGTGGFVVGVNRSDISLDGYYTDCDYHLRAENAGNGEWFNSSDVQQTVPFTVGNVTSLSFLTKGNGFTISLNDNQVINVPDWGDITIHTVNITEDCTLTGTAVKTD